MKDRLPSDDVLSQWLPNQLIGPTISAAYGRDLWTFPTVIVFKGDLWTNTMSSSYSLFLPKCLLTVFSFPGCLIFNQFPSICADWQVSPHLSLLPHYCRWLSWNWQQSRDPDAHMHVCHHATFSTLNSFYLSLRRMLICKANSFHPCSSAHLSLFSLSTAQLIIQSRKCPRCPHLSETFLLSI